MHAPRLLIVDDEEVFTKYLRMGLEDEARWPWSAAVRTRSSSPAVF